MAAAQNNSTLVVFGATGKQGGSVARAAAKSGRFSNVRLITRNVENAKAKESLAELQKLAAGRTKFELVAATFDDKASLDAALAGADYLFFVTNWWELFAANGGAPGEAGFVAGKKAGEIELTQGKNVIDAAKKAGIKFTVFSGLEDSRKSGFKNIYHFHYKGEIEEYMWANVAGATVRLAFYLENFGGMFTLRDGALTMPIPDDVPFPMVAVDEAGAIVDGVFKQVVEYGPAYWDKEAIGAANGAVTGKEIAALWAKAAGKPVTFQSVPAATYANFGFPGDAELAEMFQFQLDEKNCRRDSALSRALATDRLSTVAEWFAANSATLKF